MTTIVGVQYEDKCVLGADSQVTDPDGRIQRHSQMVKISQRGDLLIAGSGEVNPCDIAQHIWNPPKLTAAHKKDVYHFAITKVVPSLRKCLKDNGYNFEEERDKSTNEQRFHFLIAVGGEIFDISDDLSVTRSQDGLYAVGNGSAYALGALHAGAKAEEALEIAEKLDAYTSGPFQVVEQEKVG
jgi:ATP-dependent protease HslVU (ClpYQ) peptidase subunit